MDDPHKFGAEIAALAISRLKEIGLAVEEVASKRARLDRVNRSVNSSIELGRSAQLRNGRTIVDAEEWFRAAHAAFSAAMESARKDLRNNGLPVQTTGSGR
jgi:hypothetical protein